MSSDQSLGALPEELNIGSNIPHDPTPTHMSGGYMESQALFYNLRFYRNSSWLEVGLELGNCVFTRMALKLGRTSASQSEACIALYQVSYALPSTKDDMLPAVTLQHL